MKIFKKAAIAMVIVCCITLSVAHAARYIVYISQVIPASSSTSGYISEFLTKNGSGYQYLQNKNSFSVSAKIGGTNFEGNNGWSPSWETASANSWKFLGASGNPTQYGMYAGNLASLRLKSTTSSARSFSGIWITDEDLYNAFK